MSRVQQLVSTLHETLEELVRIEEESNRRWRGFNEDLSVLDHEMEIVPLNGPQLLKVASFRKKMRIERRACKNDWYASKAFNDSFQTVRILNSMANAQKALRRQQKQGENLIENRGFIASILSTEKAVPELELTDGEVLEEAAKKIAATFVEVKETADTTN